MGLSKDYAKKETLTPQQMTLLNSILGKSGGFMNQAAQGFQQFLPGGGGGEAIKQQAMQDYKQQTIPSILSSFGAGSKGSTSMNQALASSGANLNTNLASMLSQLQLQAAQGLGGLGMGGSQLGLGTPAFAYQQPGSPIWANSLKGAAAGGAAGAPFGPWGAGIGAGIGGIGGLFG